MPLDDTAGNLLHRRLNLADGPHHQLKSAIFPLQIPLPPDVREGWTRGLPYLSCHASSLSAGNCPHAPHAHREEELLLLLSGEVDLILPGLDRESQNSRCRLRRGEFVYYPSYFAHTLETMSADPANYLMLKWQGQKAGIKQVHCLRIS